MGYLSKMKKSVLYFSFTRRPSSLSCAVLYSALILFHSTSSLFFPYISSYIPQVVGVANLMACAAKELNAFREVDAEGGLQELQRLERVLSANNL